VVIRLVALFVALLASAAASAAAAERFIPLLGPGDLVPPIPLTAQDGRRFTLADLHGNAVAVSFIYTRCADPRMCPLVTAKFARAQTLTGAAPIRLVLLTLDPGFDTPPVLARYGRAFNQDARRWTLATGSPATTAELAERLGIAAAVTAPGTIVHTEAAVIIAPDGRIAQTVYGNDWTVDDLLGYARATLPASGSNPFSGLRAWLSSTMERCGGGNLALGGTAMLGVLLLFLALVGGAFWHAFREPKPRDVSVHR
jgi:cytochrome oxidase Cu insertion factor (SCO1/SenC/PrrC family)